MEIYLVGGAVRDELLGRPVIERDWVVVGATPEEMLRLGYKPVGRDFPVFLHPSTKEEYALARTERKTAPGYRGFTIHAAPDVTLEQDLARRDLTVNAMAQTESGEILDPWGGLDDLKRKQLRHVSPAFAEDPVRILRVARFAARFAADGFEVADETTTLMAAIVESGEVNELVPERIWRETAKALTETRPERFIEVLRSCGALAKIFPEIDCLFGVPQPPKWHPEIDTGIHTLLVLRQAAALTDDPRVRFAAMVHDLGKGTTRKEILPAHHGHEQRGARLIRELCRRLKVPNDYRDLAILVSKFHGLCHTAAELRPETVLKLFENTDAFRRPGRFEEFLLACEADMRGRTGFEDVDYPQAGLLRAAFESAARAKPEITENLSGPAIGRLLRDARLQNVRKILRKIK
jgi:tRNA nucleotidyltransferase (CCA-adding enzyme)